MKCENMTKVIFPENLLEIPDKAFYYCFALETINIPKSIKRIGKSAFEHCRVFAHPIVFHEGLEIIEKKAFSVPPSQYKSDLGLLSIPQSVKFIGNSAFCCCYFNAVVFKPGCVAELSSGALYGIDRFIESNFTALYIPNSMTKMEESFRFFVPSETRSYVDGYGNKSQINIPGGYSESIPKNLTIYCENGSVAMKFARANGIKCAEYESNFNEFLKEVGRTEAE